MITNEMEFDETVITVMDDDGLYEDIKVFLDDTEVYIRQYNEITGQHDLVYMSCEMYLQMLSAMKLPEGMFKFEFKDKKQCYINVTQTPFFEKSFKKCILGVYIYAYMWYIKLSNEKKETHYETFNQRRHHPLFQQSDS